MHQNTSTTSATNPIATIRDIGRDPVRLMTIREWFHRIEPHILDMLEDPEAAFVEDEGKLINLCRQNEVYYREASEGREAAFPVWLLLAVQTYLLNR